MGFSASRISAFTLLTNTPGGIGIIAGGRLADLRGRRVVGSIALFGGTICTVWFFVAQGWTMWLASAIGAIVGAAAVPALGVYSAELFPTSLRGKANAAITVLALIGSGVGLIAAGAMSDRWDEFAPGMALLALGPMVVCILVLKLYPGDGTPRARGAQPGGRRRPSPLIHRATTSAISASLPFRSWRAPSIHTCSTAPAIRAVAASSSAGVPN